MTALVKTTGDTTLGIGDGANDVGMIQEAHIGALLLLPILFHLHHSDLVSCTGLFQSVPGQLQQLVTVCSQRACPGKEGGGWRSVQLPSRCMQAAWY